MAAPKYVPTAPRDVVRSYHSPPRRPAPWRADRPGELTGRQPLADRLGVPGPDPGYVLRLVSSFRGTLTLHAGESESDAVSGAMAVALKRSGLVGRAPVMDDLRVAFGVWGFLDADPAAELVELRRERFEEVHHPYYYEERRRIADAVPAQVLLRPHDEILRMHASDWRSCLDLTV